MQAALEVSYNDVTKTVELDALTHGKTERSEKFCDQLHTFDRGEYYESYQHGGKPEVIPHLDEFLEKVRHETDHGHPAPDPEESLQVVSTVLAKHIDQGQYLLGQAGLASANAGKTGSLISSHVCLPFWKMAGGI